MALSKDWTLQNARGILRILANQIAGDEVQDLGIDDFIHLAISDLAELLGEAGYPDYGEVQTFTAIDNGIGTTNGIDSIILSSLNSELESSLKIDQITKVVGVTNGLFIEISAKEFDGLSSIPQKTSNVFWFKFGDLILMYPGSDLNLDSTIYVYYNRTPTKATADSDYLDVKDKFVKLALDKAKIMIYEQLNMASPESLTNQINANIQQIRQTNIQESQIVKNGN